MRGFYLLLQSCNQWPMFLAYLLELIVFSYVFVWHCSCRAMNYDYAKEKCGCCYVLIEFIVFIYIFGVPLSMSMELIWSGLLIAVQDATFYFFWKEIQNAT